MDCIGKFVEIRPVYNEINEIKEYRCEVCRRILWMKKEDFERLPTSVFHGHVRPLAYNEFEKKGGHLCLTRKLQQ